MSSDAAVRLLASVPLFADLDEAELMLIARLLKPATFRSGNYLCRQGQAGDCMYMIQSGEADVLVRGQDGKELRVAKLRAGDIAGELNMIDGTARGADVVAGGLVKTFRLERDTLSQMRARFHPAAFKILRRIGLTICRRIRGVNDIVGDSIRKPQQAVAPQAPQAQPLGQAPGQSQAKSGTTGIRADSWDDFRKKYRKLSAKQEREQNRGFWTGVMGKLVGG